MGGCHKVQQSNTERADLMRASKLEINNKTYGHKRSKAEGGHEK